MELFGKGYSENVVVIVEDSINWNEKHHYQLLEVKLLNIIRNKMMRKKLVEFSSNFELVETIKHDFQYPFEVKISYLYGCVLVTDYYNSRIVTFDLKTKKYISDVSIRFPRCCAVERGEKTDFLIVTCINSSIYKFDIKDILCCTSTSSETLELWENKRDCNWPNGVDVSYQHTHNLIYVCDTDENAIRVLNSNNGELIKNIYSSPSLTINEPWAICIGNDYLFFSSHFQHSITVVRKEDFTKIGELQDESYGEFKLPCSIIMDRESDNLMKFPKSNNSNIQ